MNRCQRWLTGEPDAKKAFFLWDWTSRLNPSTFSGRFVSDRNLCEIFIRFLTITCVEQAQKAKLGEIFPNIPVASREFP